MRQRQYQQNKEHARPHIAIYTKQSAALMVCSPCFALSLASRCLCSVSPNFSITPGRRCTLSIIFFVKPSCGYLQLSHARVCAEIHMGLRGK
jgi:hypothetical protein